jgi:UDP-glucose 4-epimerase
MAACLVTGGAGFIGSHLVEQLVARHHAVRVLDNLTGGSLFNLSRVLHAIELYPGDVADLDLLRKVMQGVDFVFHLAAAPGPIGDLPQAGSTVHPDVVGTRNVLHAAAEAGARRVAYASSLLVYGATGGAVCHEERALQPRKTLPVEGEVKALCEKTCVDFTRDHSLETVRLRYFHVFGPRQPRHSPYARVVTTVLDAVVAGHSPVLEGDGRVGQDLVSVGDAVYANLTAIEAPRVSGKAFNVGRGLPVTALDLLAATNTALCTRIEPTFTAGRPLDAFDNLADPSRAEAELGYCAGEDLPRCLRLCVERPASWMRRPLLGHWGTAARSDAQNGHL